MNIPVHITETIGKILFASRQILEETGKKPTTREVAARLQMPVDRVGKVLKIARELAEES